MCYLVREQQAGAAEGAAPLPPAIDRLRARWVGAAGAALIGGLALAALVTPSTSTAPLLSAKDSGAPAPVASRSVSVPAAGGAQQTSLPMDDGVPTATSDTPKSGFGNCHHGL